MIVEVILSTLDATGQPNFAPMGVIWGDQEIIVKPFRSTHTYANLLRTGFAVANVTDDVQAFVDTALAYAQLPHIPAQTVPGVVCEDACYWRELALVSVTGSPDRAEMLCRVAGRGWRRDFLGFNRARGAVLEATIVATRLHLLGSTEVEAALARSAAIVCKTGDHDEQAALDRVWEYVRRWHAGDNR
jgi:hypothetical protein